MNRTDELKIEYMQVDFGKLELEAGDILVLNFHDAIPQVHMSRIQEELKKIIPEETKIIFLQNGVDIGVIKVNTGEN